MKNHRTFPFQPCTFGALSLALLGGFASETSSAATKEWDGSASGSWSSAGNWSDNLANNFNNTADLVFSAATWTRSGSYLGNATSGAVRTVRSMTYNDTWGAANGAIRFNSNNSSSSSAVPNHLLLNSSSGTSTVTLTSGMSGSVIWGTNGNSVYGDLQLGTNTVFDFQGSGTLNVNAPITEVTAGRTVTKEGPGTLVFSARTASYTGATTITAGKLRGIAGGNCASSEVILGDVAGTFGVSITNNTKSWTCAALTAAAAGTLEFDFGTVTPSDTVSPLTVTAGATGTGLADFTSATPLVSVVVGSGLPVGTYPLITWDSTTGTAPTTAELSLSQVSAGTAASLSISGNTLNLVIDFTGATIVKAANTNDLNRGSSWVGGTAPDDVSLASWDNTVTTANTTVLGADLTWGGIAIKNPTGPVTINAGNTLTLGVAPVDLDLSAATADLTLNCALVLGDTNIWNVAASRTLTLGGVVSGPFPVTKQGDGLAILSNANTYNGNTLVSAGTLQLGASEVIPNGGGTGNVSVGGTLDLNGNSETINGLSGSGSVDSVSGGTPRLTVGDNNQSSTFSGVIQNTAGTLDLVKTGSGTVVLGGANTLAGSVTVEGGTLAFANTAPFDNISGIAMADGTKLRPDVVNAVISAPITVGTIGTTATINAPSVAGGGGTSAVPFTLDGAISGAGNVTFSGIEAANAYGTIILQGASDYQGSTLITCTGSTNTQIFVRLGTDNALPTTTVLTLDGGNGAGGGRFCDLDLNGHNQTLAGLTNVTGRTLRTQRVNNPSATPATLTINESDSSTFAGQLGGGGTNFGLTKSGSGVFTVTGARSYAGDTTVTAGTLSLGTTNGGNDLSTVTVASGAKLELTYAGTDTVAALVINGVPQAGGVYGHTDSGADNGGQGVGFFDPYFAAGTGTITLPAAFAAWITGTFANGTVTDQGPNGDDDNDGISNLVEYAIAGQDPTVPNAAIGSFDGSTLSFTKRADTSGLTYAIQESIDLGLTDDWTEVPAGPSYTNNPTTISYNLTPGTPVRNFIRLQVLSN